MIYKHKVAIWSLAGSSSVFAVLLFVIVSNLMPETKKPADTTNMTEKFNNSKAWAIDTDGTTLYRNKDGQTLRMWTFVHHMEAWLLDQDEDIEIERMYLSVVNNDRTFLRYYILYRVRPEKKPAG